MKYTIIAILIAYLPLIIAGAILYYRKRRKQSNSPAQKYSSPEGDIPHKERLLSDEAVPDEYEEVMERLYNMFETQKLYLDPNIRISDIADKLFTNKTYLSKAIKARTNKNFCQLIHYYRVREAVAIFSANPDLTITQLSKQVGFNSMTTFNSAFGRNTGYTPAEWCKDFRKKNKLEERYVSQNNG